MISQAVLKLGQRCRRLSGFARNAGQKVAAAGSEPFLPLIGSGRAFLDLYEHQVYLGAVLESWHTQLVELDGRLLEAVERGRELREARRLLSARLRGDLSGLQDALSGVLEARAVRQLLRPIDRVPKDAAELQPLAARLFDRLTDPTLGVPTLPNGVEIDPPAMARGFEGPMRQLGATLAELIEVEAAVQDTRAKKAAALERLTLFAKRVERYFVALYELSGCPELAKRLVKGGR